VIPYPTSGVGDIRLEILNEVWATDPNIASFIILEMMGYINGDSKKSSSSDYSIGYNDGYSQYNSDLQSLLLAKYGKATVSEAVTAGIEAGVNVGETSVTSNPTAYNLVSKDAYDQALLDANASAEQAIADAKVLAKAEGVKEGKASGKSEGETSVTSNPTAYNLVSKDAYDQALLDANTSAEEAIADAKVLAKAEGIEEGKTLGISEGESSVISNPSVYNLVTKSSYDQALLDANATAEQAIANAQVSAKAEGINEGKAIGKSEGQSSVTSNPTAYNLVTQVAYDQMMNDLMSALDSNATHYTEGWFYHPGRGWMWTTFSAYPYFYDARDKDWIYFHSGNEKPKFYRYKTKTWLTIE
jgi:flagellar biosynthesis/type III secretory pathway protein FliH